MPAARLTVVITRRLPEAVETRMKELFDVELRDPDTPMTREELAAAMRRADVLVPTITDTIDAALLAQAGEKLKLIANYGSGVDHIDVATARQRGVIVSNTPGVVTRLGILGMGRIGQAVARRARAFGLQVHYHNRKRLRPEIEAEHEATYWESLDQMIARMDILSINCPHTPSTFHLLNARRLRLMKPSAVVVNTSRGEVVDENALTRALRAGELAGAGLDVYERGTDLNPRLRELPNVVCLPHMGSATIEGRIEMGEKVIINIKTFADGHRPPDQVVPGQF